MKITALIENKALGTLKKEHGLSVHISFGGKNYLLDTGGSDRYAINAEALGISLSDVDTAFLSHAHADHSGGYKSFFTLNSKAKVYLKESSKESCYFKIAGPFYSNVSIPSGILSTYPDRFIFVKDHLKIDEGVFLLSHHSDQFAERSKKAHMYRKINGKLIPDDLTHEQSLIFHAKAGLIILNSCCHAGVETIIAEAKDAFPGIPVAAVIGGFHLMGLAGPKTMAGSKNDIRLLADRINSAGVMHIYTGHCTGTSAYRILKENLKEKADYFPAGKVLFFEES